MLQLILNKVLMLGSATQTLIGRPVLPDATVHAIVEEHVRVDTYYFLFSLGLYMLCYKLLRIDQTYLECKASSIDINTLGNTRA